MLLAALVVFGGSIHAQPVAVQSPNRSEVFIWYVNATDLDDTEWRNWDTIIAWLRSSDNTKCRKIAGQLENDREKFPAAVNQEMAVLRERLPRYGVEIGAALFTNRSVRQGKYLLLPKGHRQFCESSITVPDTDQPLLAKNPMSRPEVLALCLRETAKRFDPAHHDFILFTKSHGNPKMAMTPRLWVRPEEANRKEVIAVASGELAEDKRPAWSRRRFGITKDEFFGIVAQAGREEGMQFSLVFMEACDGVLGENVSVRPPENIRRLYMTGTEHTKFQNFDYAASLVPQTPPVPLSQCLDAILAPKYPVLVRGSSQGFPWQLFLYWLPLVVLLSWLTVRRVRARRKHDLGRLARLNGDSVVADAQKEADELIADAKNHVANH